MIQWKLSAALLLTAQLAQAWRPTTDRWTCGEGNLCLTSFVWCAAPRDDVDGCYFPPNTWPWFNRDFGSNPGAVLDWLTYNLTWQNADPAYPVQVIWNVGSRTTSDPNQPGLYGNWSRNFTDVSSFQFTFNELVNEFPTSTSNLSSAEVYGLITRQSSTFSISQPEAPLPSGVNWPLYDFSDQFYVYDGSVRIFLETQADIARQAEKRKWTLGVGIGVGVGVPLFLIAAFTFGCFFGKRKGKKAAVQDTKLSTSS